LHALKCSKPELSAHPAQVVSHYERRIFPVEVRCNHPTRRRKRIFGASISFNIRAEFPLPEVGAAIWCRAIGAARVTMPEAAVNQERQPMARKNQVGSFPDILAVETEAVAEIVSRFADENLWLGVFGPDSRNHFASAFLIDNIHSGRSRNVAGRFETGNTGHGTDGGLNLRSFTRDRERPLCV
jgi:hypothetical protein